MGIRTIPIIDSQVHAYERDHPGRPWAGVLAGPPEVTGDDMAAAMDAVGVDGALLVSPYTMYRFDASYAVEVHARHPGRFALVKPVDPTDPAVAETVAEWAAQAGAVAVRIMMAHAASIDPGHPGVGRALDAAARRSLPVNLLCWGLLDEARHLARAHPDTVLVIDHLGLRQPFEPPAPASPFADLPKLLALAECANVMVKVSGACTLSHEPFPYPDLRDPPRPRLRWLRHRSLHVGHGLDPRRQPVDLRAGRGGVSPDRAPERRRARGADGRDRATGLRLGAVRRLTGGAAASRGHRRGRTSPPRRRRPVRPNRRFSIMPAPPSGGRGP